MTNEIIIKLKDRRFYSCSQLYNCLYILDQVIIGNDLKEKYRKYICNLRSPAIVKIFNKLKDCEGNNILLVQCLKDEMDSGRYDDYGCLFIDSMISLRV